MTEKEILLDFKKREPERFNNWASKFNKKELENNEEAKKSFIGEAKKLADALDKKRNLKRQADNLKERVRNLTSATWKGAKYNDKTKFPEGFDPEKAGMIKTDD